MKGNMKIGSAVKTIVLTLLAMVLCVAIVLSFAVGASNRQNRNFKETFYSLSSEKVADSLRIIQISDLHAVEYDNLVHRIKLLEPDLIVLTGDIVDKDTRDVTGVLKLCGQLAETAPTCYVYGHHERLSQYGMELMEEEIKALSKDQLVWGQKIESLFTNDTLQSQVEAVGVQVLLNEQTSIQVGETTVDVYGVLTSSSAAFYEYAEDTFYQYAYQDDENFKLMLIHEPYLMDVIGAEDWGDLVLCGHTHGGVIRLPGVGGLYESLYGFLPEFLNKGKILGQYSVRGIPVIVSGGMTNEELRINNQPELVIIDINHY